MYRCLPQTKLLSENNVHSNFSCIISASPHSITQSRIASHYNYSYIIPAYVRALFPIFSIGRQIRTAIRTAHKSKLSRRPKHYALIMEINISVINCLYRNS